MRSKSTIWFSLAVLAAVIAALAAPSLALAGGWAVILLDRLPEGVTAGQPYPIGFTVRQHGFTLWEVDEISITAEHVETGQVVNLIAKPDGQPGHYQAELLLPQPGAWEWAIRSGLHPERQPMPALEVGETTLASGEAQPGAGGTNPANSAFPGGAGRASSATARALGLAAVAALAAGVVLIVHGRTRQPFMWAGAGLIVLCAGLAFAFFSSANADARQIPVTAGVMTSQETGQRLFLAKGCVVCHVNNRAIENSEELSVQIGPNLSLYHNDADYLSKFLADPEGVKPTTKMPDLDLAPAEIEALVAFINDGKAK